MRIREVQKKPSKPRDPNAKAMQDLRKSGAAGSHGDKTKDIPRNDKHKKAYDINTENEDVMKDKIKAWADKYDGYIGSNGDSLPEGYVEWALNTGIAEDFIETNERDKMIEKYGKDKFDEDPFAFLDEMPITKACMEELEKITGSTDIDNNAELIKKHGDLGYKESGIMYRAGVKKYGKAGMKAIQSAAGKGASHQEIGKIKDKHLKDEVGETATVGATAAGNIATVANPHIANSKAKPKKQKPTDNALDNKSHGLFGQPIKRLNNSKEVTMDKNKELQEDLADLASKAEQDHEVQMARAQLYKIAKYSIKLHDMLKGVSEQEGLEGWVQSKITKASDYIGAVYHNMDYEQKFEEVSESADCGCDTHETHSKCKDDCDCDPVTEGKAKNPKQQAAIAIAKKKDGYKESLADKLDAKISEKSKGLYYNVNKRKKAGTSRKKGHPKAPTKQDWENAAKTAKESSIEEKQKGVDGKACWDGYKRMGTKKKGGKTVDNCVKMQFHES